jgi:hypothetical protein
MTLTTGKCSGETMTGPVGVDSDFPIYDQNMMGFCLKTAHRNRLNINPTVLGPVGLFQDRLVRFSNLLKIKTAE